MVRSAALLTVAVAVFALPIVGTQRSGQRTTISVGVVSKLGDIGLRSQAAPVGALVGGMLAYHTTGSSRSSSTKWGRAAAGVVAGGALARAGEEDLSGKLYTVGIDGGRRLQAVSDQTEIRHGD